MPPLQSMTQFAGLTKTSGLKACELKAETVTSRHFVLGNITLRAGLNNKPPKKQTHHIQLIFSNLSTLQYMHDSLQKVNFAIDFFVL